MFCFGFATLIITLNVHKTTSTWFPGNQLGLANGILAASMGVGIALGSSINATILSPLLGGWRNVLFLWGGISIVLSILWSLSRREPGFTEADSQSPRTSFREGLSGVMGIKPVWMLSMSSFFLIACQMGMFGYLPLFLRNSGWSATNADIAFSLIGVLGAVGAVLFSFVSDRAGSRKKILIIIYLITMVGVGFLSIANFHMMWIIIIAIGLCREAFPAITTTFLMELKELDRRYIGTALGLRGSVSMIGGFMGPPIGNSLAGISPGLPFYFLGRACPDINNFSSYGERIQIKKGL